MSVMLSCLFLAACGHLLGKGCPIGSLVYDVFLCVFFNFPYGVLGQVLYLILWIPDLCLLPYFPDHAHLAFLAVRLGLIVTVRMVNQTVKTIVGQSYLMIFAKM